MALCVNQSGTWRYITTQCVNQSGTWRDISLGCINNSGTWRRFLPARVDHVSLGTAIEGGRLICRSSNVAWIVAPSSAEVSRTSYNSGEAPTRAQQVSGCTGWFLPTIGQLQNPGYTCRTYWDSYSSTVYWSGTGYNDFTAWVVNFADGSSGPSGKGSVHCIRAFRCVTY